MLPCCFAQNPELVQQQIHEDILLAKVYNTQHHQEKAYFHGHLDESCKTGKTAKSCLNMFKEVLTPLSVMKPMVRFKMMARLPAGVFVDSPGSDISTITLDSMSTISPGTCFEEGMIVDESMAGNSQKSVFQKTLDAVIDVWRNSQ